MLGFHALCDAPLCALAEAGTPVPPIPPASGGGGTASGGGKRNLPKLEELAVFKCLEKRKPGQSIVECLREMDTPEEIAEAQEALVVAQKEVKRLSHLPTKEKHEGFLLEARTLRQEIAALQRFLQEREARWAQEKEDEDDDDFLLMSMM